MRKRKKMSKGERRANHKRTKLIKSDNNLHRIREMRKEIEFWGGAATSTRKNFYFQHRLRLSTCFIVSRVSLREHVTLRFLLIIVF